MVNGSYCTEISMISFVSFQFSERLTTSGKTNYNEWYNERQQMVERMTTSGITNNND